MTISQLKKGDRGIIKDFLIEEIPLKLIEMGCLPGSEVELLYIAPLNDPLFLRVNGSSIAIRKAMASKIQISPIN